MSIEQQGDENVWGSRSGMVETIEAPSEFIEAADSYLDAVASAWRSGGWQHELIDEHRDALRGAVIYDVAWRTIDPTYQEWITGSDSSNYVDAHKTDWETKFRSYQHFDWFLAHLENLLPFMEAIKQEQLTSYTYLARQSFILNLLSEIYDVTYGVERSSGTADKPKEEEKEAEEEEEDDEEEGGAEAKQAKLIIKSIQNDFSYVPEISVLVGIVIERTPLRVLVNGASKLKAAAIAGFEKFKSAVKAVADFFGLKGAFLALDRAMRRNRIFEVSTRLVGTGVYAVLFLIFIVGWPVYRFYNSPQRIFKVLGKAIEIDIPGQDEE